MNSVAYVGMDVDSRKIAMALLEAGAKQTEDRIVANEPQEVERYFSELVKRYETVYACYEAGSCGFELWRQVTELGVVITVVSPGSVPRKSGDRVKTDRRDARKLARALRNGDLSPVYVPSVADEEARDYLRLYEDMKYDLKRAKQRLLHFLMRHGIRWTEGSTWTDAHWRWLRRLEFDSSVARATYEEYLTQIVDLTEKCQRIAAEIERIAQQECYREPVRRLKAFKGVETLIALSLVVEIGNFERFEKAEQFMAFLGLVPSEHSSGERRRVGGITKAGNSHLRKLLIQSAWHYRSYHPNSRTLLRRRQGLPADLVSYANRAGRRLNRKFLRIVFAGRPSQIAATAVARELAGFMWGAMLNKVA
jgi:transposase